ncbi:5-methyltetrahydropteroyltriglutamate--homocysteine S-methyltransferase [Lactobacillaceae bacterium L1_55_11]|nr:5-methyltetrahydropteroyltriglutamate--homocysteine S-methyltransferase [Lactobacillaceae bacterium L1_55_11]
MPKFKDEWIHYDIVGSFLRPKALKEAVAAHDQGKISDATLTEVQDREIKDLVNKEVDAGLKFVTDGEFRRRLWHLDTFWGFGGVKKIYADQGYLFHDLETRKDSAIADGKIRFTGDHPDLRAFKYLYKITRDLDVVPRQSIPSPAQFYLELIRDEEHLQALNQYYDNHADLQADIAQAYHELILALYDAGCRDLKFDDCTWGMLVDKSAWPKLGLSAENIGAVQENYLNLNNRALTDLPADLRTSTHVCRGNYASNWASSGGYEPVAKTLFAQENVDAFYLEFDDTRSGDFSPLTEVPDQKEIVLGLVTSKSPRLEDSKQLIKRVHEASQYHDLDKLSLSTQCGFASTDEGNHLTEAEQWAKIKLVVDTAREIWQPVTV